MTEKPDPSPPPGKGHVYVVDDDPSVRNSLARMLTYMGFEVEAHAGPQEFLKNSLPVAPAVLLLDMRMPGYTGLQLQKDMARLGRHTPMVFMSGESEPQEIIDALTAGACHFLLKPFNMDDLLRAIYRAMALDRERLANYRDEVDARLRYELLTPRERDVCQMVVKGLMNKEIAEHFDCSLKTIKVHRARVMEKMGVGSLLELVEAVSQVESRV
ncbi:MAG: response regulator transcription factor [Hydrogenophaga sp.]|jgi:FixJ family two-component response regulator|nr:response regulator [Hydrogenophaga sp.]